ncbi:hypothetical protein J2X68_007760 [Streptomyces sp. 3330]|uniref:hypothetical protein n=1 Tax=Streptomyces sp. 3330 TaxID=2817755 RepID=UPI00285BACBD|nr:hypothetical protein [Streptomyces sp. 3330]MDR6981018.1 hypothetical protein [Streptomyces sp. 3330]
MSGHRPAARSGVSAPESVSTGQRDRFLHRDHRVPRSALTAYTAFRERHYEPYLLYAALRIGRPGAAEAAVTAAFTELAMSWTAILGDARPAAAAWRILHDHVDRALGYGPADVSADHVVQMLRRDAYVLDKRMHLSRDRIAEVLGIRPGDLHSLLPRFPER